MPGTDDPILRFERHLREAVEDFAKRLWHHVGGALPHRGIIGSTVSGMEALLVEEGRLRRQARRDAPCYDLNRHIAVRRLIAKAEAMPGPVR